MRTHVNNHPTIHRPAWLTLASLGLGLWLTATGAPATAQTEQVEPWRIDYELDKPGRVSMAVYNDEGRLLRTLLTGAPHEAGEHAVTWDGLDSLGRPMSPGDYTWKLLRTPGFEAEYRVTVGTNASSAPYDVWVGNHTGPYAAWVDDEQRMFIGAPISEGVNYLLAQSLDGAQRLWDAAPYPGRGESGVTALSGDGGQLYVLARHAYVEVRDAETGRVQKMFDVLWPDAERPSMYRHSDMDVVGGDGWFAVSHPEHDAVRWFDVASEEEVGQLAWRSVYTGVSRTVRVPEPMALCAGPNDVIYALSQGRVVALDPDDAEGHRMLIAASQLDQPRHIAYDPAHDELLVAHGQPRPNQVSRFSRDGEHLATLGRAGGRAFGPWQPRDFYRITSIAADRQGGFIVTEAGENTVRRTAHFDRDGELINEWFGGQRWGNFVTWDPADATRVSFIAGEGVRAFAEVDYDNAAWRMLSVYPEPDTGGMFPSLDTHNAIWELQRRNGELYLVTSSGVGGPTSRLAIYRVDAEQHRFVPVARAGDISSRWSDPDHDAPAFWRQIKAHHRQENPERDLSRYNAYTWTDPVGNGEIRPEDVQLAAREMAPSFQGQMHLDEHWNFYFAPRYAPRGATDQTPAWYHVPNLAESGDTPRWDWQRIEPAPARLPDALLGVRSVNTTGLHRDAHGAMYQVFRAERLPDDDRQGDVWPGATNGMIRVVRWDAKGQTQWAVGRSGTSNEMPPGDFQDTLRILGEVHGNIIVHDRVVRPATAWTPDGLYAGYLMEGRVEDEHPDYSYHTWAPTPTTSPKTAEHGLLLHDHISGIIHVTDDGEVLWNPSGRGGAVIYRIHGWDGWTHREGTVRIDRTPPHAEQTGTGLRGEYFFGEKNAEQLQREPDLTRTDAQLWFGPRRMPWTADPRRPRQWFDADAPHTGDELAVVRWTGHIEPRFSEAYRFTTESDAGSRVRLWIDDALILDAWSDSDAERLRWQRLTSERIDMKAGHRYRIRVEYVPGGHSEPAMHLNWESFHSQERQHVPASVLHSPFER